MSDDADGYGFVNLYSCPIVEGGVYTNAHEAVRPGELPAQYVLLQVEPVKPAAVPGYVHQALVFWNLETEESIKSNCAALPGEIDPADVWAYSRGWRLVQRPVAD